MAFRARGFVRLRQVVWTTLSISAWAPIAISAAIGGGLLAQGRAEPRPAPDRIELNGGRVLEGFVVQSYGPEVLLLQDGRRERVAKRGIASMELRRDRVREFLGLRERAPARASAQWTLTEWALSRGLPHLARLQALEYLLTSDRADESQSPLGRERLVRAHELLGHRRRGRGGPWLWPYRDQFVPLEKLLAESTSWGRAIQLRSEHFAIKSTGGPVRAARALFDLEALLAWLHERFGEGLLLQEALDPVDVNIWGSPEDFPAWTSDGVVPMAANQPYFIPSPFGDAVYTHYPSGDDRPARLFAFATQAILYRTLQVGAVSEPKHRFAAWVELGLGEWVESCIVDDTPGRVRFGDARRDDLRVDLSLRARRLWGIEDLIHLNLRDHFYDALNERTPLYWADVHMLVTFLLADETMRPRFLEFVRQALAEGKGNSSSRLDKILGRRIEELQEPWMIWLRSAW